MTASSAAYYRVRYRESGTEDWSDPQRFDPVAELVISGLDRTKTYEYEVQAVSSCGAKSVWVSSDFTVPADPAGTIKLADVESDASDAKAKTDLAIDGPTGKIKTGFLTPRKIAQVDFDGTADISIPLDNINDGTTYRRVGAAYVDSGRVTKLWDGTAPRDATDLWTGASRATEGLDAGGLVKKDIPGAHLKYADGSTVESLKPAAAGADVTARNAVYGPNSIVNPGAETGELYPHYVVESGGTWSVGNQDDSLHSGSKSVLYR